MYSKLFTLFALSAIASAQTLLQPLFQLSNKALPLLRLDVEGDCTEPGSRVVLTPATPTSILQGDDASQTWVYNDQTGTIKNLLAKGTDLVLTAPVQSLGGPVIPNQPLTQEKQKYEPEDLNQIWYYTNDQRVIVLADTTLCLAASGLDVVMENCDENDGNDRHRWILSM